MIKEINGVQHTIDERLDNFTIKNKPSSNVAFYGVNHDAADIKLFVQFKNGSCYIYSGLTDQTLIDLNECDSIGKFISKHIVGKFTNTKEDNHLVIENGLPIILLQGEVSDFRDNSKGMVIVTPEGADVTFLEPEEPTF